SWAALRRHTATHRSELVLLPEFAFVEPVWEATQFEPDRWEAAVERSDAWLERLRRRHAGLERLPERPAGPVVGPRPASVGGRPFNQGYLWSRSAGVQPLRSKFHLPKEPGGGGARWVDRGDAVFPQFQAGALSFGLNICSELWAVETYAAYAE